MSSFDDRNCRSEDPEVFFPDHADRAGVAVAKAVCVGCPVAVACLELALVNERGLASKARHGIYGGLTPQQRARMAREAA